MYNISVKTSNVFGESTEVNTLFRTPSSKGNIYRHKSKRTNLQLFYVLWFAAPSASPEVVNASTMSSSIIHISWGEVPCPQHNGEITGYIVEYSRRGGGVEERVNVSTNNHTILISSTFTDLELRVRVAAVNEIGIGPFSDLVLIVRSELESS